MLLPLLLTFWCGFASSNELCQKCVCDRTFYYSDQAYVVNCTNTGLTISNATLLTHLPEETEVLIVNGNNISVLPINIFGDSKNFTKLRVIDMTSNRIEEIKGKTFHHAPLVETLILDHNAISLDKPHARVFSNFENLKELHLTDAFHSNKTGELAARLHTIFRDSNLKQLRKLNLEQNEIDTFDDPNVFCDLENLAYLYLGDNKLRELSFNITCLTHLRYIGLENNEIEGLSKENGSTIDLLFKNRSEFRVDLHGHPFVCDCTVSESHSSHRQTRLLIRNNDTIECHYLNRSNISILINKFHGHDCFHISPYYEVSNGDIHQFVHYFFFTTAFILVLCLIYLSFKYTSAYCRHTVVPTSKVHYVVIQNPDENPVHV